ncbi:MAG: DNA-directed RNA polymerase subunit omega [Oscillospiraceae bacterium]|nr:DNA-directed RNA polymerase subunit omega [Oscillospiraceae bacterium]MCI7498639.1 DNA-directed RNA polymerase subunit omega [Oscillospiraceae bacterium]MDD7278981.1 DNA-directed RNA polymerase subunit omega [Oscillospiraceae bacterium]MDY2864374.1 DNA-directed RNA polymerase subunit omega [Oscillospiraceae bacterium]
MLRPAMNQIATHGESYYSIVIGIAKRAREIADELSEKNMTLEEKPVKTAVDEFAARKFIIVEDPSVKPGKSTEGTY